MPRNPANGHERRGELMNINAFEDSVALVVPAHIGGTHTAETTPESDGLAIKSWVQFR